jgi:hypothetical protein
MTKQEFFVQVRKTAAAYNWRIGQALFNVLFDVRPDISEKLRGTRNDPFFSDTIEDKRYQAALVVIEQMWDNEE